MSANVVNKVNKISSATTCYNVQSVANLTCL